MKGSCGHPSSKPIALSIRAISPYWPMRMLRSESSPMKYLRWNFSLRLRPSDESRVRFVKLLVLLLVLLPASNVLSQEQSQDKGKFEIDLSELQKEIDQIATKPY